MNFLKQNLQDINLRDYLIFENADFNPSDNVLEIGVGLGSLAHSLSKHVNSFMGLDISPELIERLTIDYAYALPKVKYLCGDATDLNLIKIIPDRFDKIISCDTLEHVSSPQNYFKVISSLLKPSGVTLITFPNESEEKAHGITQFSSRYEIENILRNAELGIFDIYIVSFNAFASILSKIFLDLPLIIFRKLRKKHSLSKPQVFDQTWFFQASRKPSYLAFFLNQYGKIIIKTICLRHPVFKCRKTDLSSSILNKRLLIIARRR